MESRADRRTSRALHTVTTHANASDRPTYFIGELRLRTRKTKNPANGKPGVRENRTPGESGAPEGIRTPNLLIRSQMLYPLSYGR